MIIYQISLHGDAFDARGKDWRDLEAESGCKPDMAWVDPLLGRGLLKAEFGCSVSHFRVWQKIVKSGVNMIVFGWVTEKILLVIGIMPMLTLLLQKPLLGL